MNPDCHPSAVSPLPISQQPKPSPLSPREVSLNRRLDKLSRTVSLLQRLDRCHYGREVDDILSQLRYK